MGSAPNSSKTKEFYKNYFQLETDKSENTQEETNIGEMVVKNLLGRID